MGVWKNKDGKTVRRNVIPKGSQWSWWTIEMMESPPYRALSLSAHRVVARIRIELARHGGKDNGKLPVTHRDFHKYGICWDATAPAIREAEALGWIKITEWGRAGTGEWCKPTLFALTHVPIDEQKPTNDWEKIETMEAAEAIAAAARSATQKRNTTRIKRSGTVPGKRSGNGKSPYWENGALHRLQKPEHSLYFGRVAAKARLFFLSALNPSSCGPPQCLLRYLGLRKTSC